MSALSDFTEAPSREVGGSAGCCAYLSARSSVKRNLCEIFTLVVVLRQPSISSGFPQGQSVQSGTFPAETALSKLVRQRIQGLADAVLKTYSTVSSADFSLFGAPIAQSTLT